MSRTYKGLKKELPRFLIDETTTVTTTTITTSELSFTKDRLEYLTFSCKKSFEIKL